MGIQARDFVNFRKEELRLDKPYQGQLKFYRSNGEFVYHTRAIRNTNFKLWFMENFGKESRKSKEYKENHQLYLEDIRMYIRELFGDPLKSVQDLDEDECSLDVALCSHAFTSCRPKNWADKTLYIQPARFQTIKKSKH